MSVVISGTPDIPKSTKAEMPEFFRHLCIVEVTVVVMIATGFLAVFVLLSLWILFGWGDEIHQRLVITIKGMNTGWKVWLLVLVPLIFRPIYKFLIHLKEGPFGTKSEKPVDAEGQPKTETYKTPVTPLIP